MTPEDEILGADFVEHSIVYENLMPPPKPIENNKIINETNEIYELNHVQNISVNDRARAVSESNIMI